MDVDQFSDGFEVDGALDAQEPFGNLSLPDESAVDPGIDPAVGLGSDIPGIDSQVAPGDPGLCVGQDPSLAGYDVGFVDDTSASMEDILDSLNFDLDEVRTPWDSAVTEDVSGITGEIVGTPEQDAAFWQVQTTGFTCAVQAQRGIIEIFTGEDVSEAQLTYDAAVNGWLTDGGMAPSDVGRLLESYGVPCHSASNASVADLVGELAQGHKVIIGVDSGELWNQDSPLEDFFGEAPDHAIWVTGVDLSNPDSPIVIINDSGTPDGAGNEYELNDFVDAWEDSGFFYVATDTAPPDFASLAADFDPEQARFGSLCDWFSEKVGEGWDQLNSDEGRQVVQTAGATLVGIAGLIKAADYMKDSVFEFMDNDTTDQMFEMV